MNPRGLAMTLLIGVTACGRDPVTPPPPPPEAPRIVDFLPGNGVWVTDLVELEVEAPGADSASFALPGLDRAVAGPSPFRLQWDSRVAANGPQPLVARVWNASGHHDTTIVVFADNPEQPPLLVIIPGETEVVVGEAVSLAAELYGLPDRRISWSLHPVPDDGTGATEDLGTLSIDGRYTAPLVPPTAGAVLVRAAAVAAPATVEELLVRIVGVGVRVTPMAGRVNGTDTIALTAQVRGSSNVAVTWSIDEGDAHGTVTSDGLFTGPAALPEPPRATVRATSVADPTRSAAAIVALYPPVQVVAEADSIEVLLGQTRNLAAVVLHATTPEVTWSLLETSGPYGSLVSPGRYAAPAVLPLPSVAHLVARSVADPRAADTLRVILRLPLNPPPPPPNDTLGVAIAELSRASAVAIRLVDEAVDLVSRTAALAPRNANGQPILFGTVTKTPAGNLYSPSPGTHFRVVEANRPTIELFANRFRVEEWGRLSRQWPQAEEWFVGRFAGRITVEGDLDLEMDVGSTRNGFYEIESRHWVAGSRQGSTPFRVNLTSEGRRTIPLHSESGEYRTRGTLGIGPGRGSLAIDEMIEWESGNDCYHSNGSISSNWKWLARNSGTVLGSGYLLLVDVQGAIDSPCPYFRPNWGSGTGTGHLLRDAIAVGSVESGMRSDGSGTPVQVRFVDRLYPVVLPFRVPATADLIPW